MRAQPLLDRPVGEQGGLDGAVAVDGAPPVQAASGVVDVRVRPVDGAGQGPRPVRGLDDDLVQAGQGEQQRVVHAGQQPRRQILGGAVAQGQHDDGVVPLGRGALGGQRQTQQRYVSVAAAQFVAEARGADGRLPGQFAGLGQGPADPAVDAEDGGLVADREDGGEPDAEPADRGLVALALGGGPQGGQGLHAGGVERGAGVGGGEDAAGVGVAGGRGVQGEPEPAGDAGTGGGVGGVLGQLDDEAVAVAAEREVLLGVGVLPEPGGPGVPRVEHAAPQPCRPERIGPLGRLHAHALDSVRCGGDGVPLRPSVRPKVPRPPPRE